MTSAIETYEHAIEFLLSRINYERVQTEAYSTSDFKLDRMREFLARLGHPERQIPAVHVAGTKGKGSVCAMLSHIVTAAGYRTGLFTSPHLVAFEERLQIDGAMPSPTRLVALLNELRPIIDELDRLPGSAQPTYFEIATALAWQHFGQEQAHLAVLETGLGGRLDSTNVCQPIATAITSISRDHTQILGSTVREIAWEKAGIIKPGVPVISGATDPDAAALIELVASERGAPLWRLNHEIQFTRRPVQAMQAMEIAAGTRDAGWVLDVETPARKWVGVPIPLRGSHQAANTALVIGLVDLLREQGWAIEEAAVQTGLARVTWPARVEVVARQPLVVLDAAHNWESAKALKESLGELPPHRRRVLVFAATRDKDYRGILRQLVPCFDTVIVTQYQENPRSVPPTQLALAIQVMLGRPVHVVVEPAAAWRAARLLAGPEDAIVVTGSFFLISELRPLVLAEQQTPVLVQYGF